MERSKSHLSMPEVKENNYDINKNRIINLKNFQLKKIIKSDIEKIKLNIYLIYMMIIKNIMFMKIIEH